MLSKRVKFFNSSQHYTTYVYPHILVATVIANLTDIVINNNRDILVCSPRVLPLHNFLSHQKVDQGFSDI